MPLTYRQLQALPVLDWLFDVGDDERRSGRSTLIAVAIIRAACTNPSRDVFLLDHYSTNRTIDFMADIVGDLIGLDSRLATHIIWSSNRKSLRLDIPQPILDWIPPRAFFERINEITDEEKVTVWEHLNTKWI